MRVKCCVRRYEIIEAEIPDEFRKLAVSRPWENPDITDFDYDQCCKAVEKATGIRFGDAGEDEVAAIEIVWSAENDETILEF